MARARTGHVPALDGIRGLFMILFMVYHLGVQRLAGGWIVINLFFVLSAFLIVRLMVEEHERTGRVDVRAFYVRRARRLLPALLALLAVVSLWWGLLGTGIVRQRLGGDVLATLGYVMNWRLVAGADQYFADQGGASPLRHAWTLAIEEQFYLLVPFVVIGVLRLTRDRRVAAGLLLAGAVVSSGWTAVLGFHDAADYPRVYYGTDTRAQALLVGAALGMLLARGRRYRRPDVPDPVIRVAGVVGVGSSVAAFALVGPYERWMFNAGGMLAFALGSALLVLACVDSRPSWVTRIFGWPPVAHTGRLSYGLYLWHWPITLVLLDRTDWAVATRVVVGSVLTYAIAELSYRYLEVPVMRQGVRGLLPRSRAPLAVALAPVLLVALGGIALARTAPAPPREAAAPAVAPGAIPELVAGQPTYRPGQPARIGVYGDSVPYFLTTRFPADAFPGAALANYAKEGCDVLSEPLSWADGLSQEPEEACTRLKQTWPRDLERNGDQVFLFFASPILAVPHVVDGERRWLDDPRYRRAITDRYDTLREEALAAGAEQVQVVNVPCREVPSDIPEFFRGFVEQNPTMVAEYREPTIINRLVADWAAQHDDVVVIDLHGALCGDGLQEQVAGLAVYNDFLHFSPEATPMLWRWILGQVSKGYAARPR